MGLSVDEQKKAQSIRRQPNIAIVENKASGCCQGNGNFTCCQNATIMAEPEADHTTRGNENNPTITTTNNNISKIASRNENFVIPTWLKRPVPPRDTYATLAIVAAIASVSGAYLYYRN